MTEGVAEKTYEIVFSDGRRQRITIPAAWKVSFGAVVPASAKSAARGYDGGGWGLRIWEATDKQRAVYSGVAEFFDTSIPVMVKAVRKFGTEDWLEDDGSWTGKKAELVEKDWVPIDKIVRPVPNLQPVEDDEEHDPFGPRTILRKGR